MEMRWKGKFCWTLSSQFVWFYLLSIYAYMCKLCMNMYIILNICKLSYPNTHTHTNSYTYMQTHAYARQKKRSEWIFITLDWNKHSHFTIYVWMGRASVWFLKTVPMWKDHSSNYVYIMIYYDAFSLCWMPESKKKNIPFSPSM